LPQVIVASPTYLATRGRPETPAGLAGHCIVGFRPTVTLDLVGPDGAVTLTLEAQVAVNDPKTMVAVIRGGSGIGLVPRFLAQAALDDGTLEILLPDYRTGAAELSIVHYGSGPANPRADLFATFLQVEMRKHR
jgi:DNA-binding transcriptional LysR family regulator